MPSPFSLERWIQQAINNKDVRSADPTKDEPARCTHIAVVHMQGTMATEIKSIRLDGVQSAKQIAETLKFKAEEYCEELPGTQTCCYQAWYEGHEEPGAK